MKARIARKIFKRGGRRCRKQTFRVAVSVMIRGVRHELKKCRAAMKRDKILAVFFRVGSEWRSLSTEADYEVG